MDEIIKYYESNEVQEYRKLCKEVYKLLTGLSDSEIEGMKLQLLKEIKTK